MAETKPPSSPLPREKLEAQIKSADMSEDMQQEAIEVAQEAMSKFTIEKDIAQHIKRTFDEQTKHFLYFYLGHCAILLFKTQYQSDHDTTS
ncbi:probable dynein light chain type 1 [Cephalotrichum gorgonifer]|uniref:Dynein light chain n=1 Tax=Cephalotrichum gorgonifer TaxID=2041049 RepID=A0AAE8MX35_9PEZI|nr:probable dynein light chain type 1 [Cephalotrichum gorgonifer]